MMDQTRLFDLFRAFDADPNLQWGNPLAESPVYKRWEKKFVNEAGHAQEWILEQWTRGLKTDYRWRPADHRENDAYQALYVVRDENGNVVRMIASTILEYRRTSDTPSCHCLVYRFPTDTQYEDVHYYVRMGTRKVWGADPHLGSYLVKEYAVQGLRLPGETYDNLPAGIRAYDLETTS